jgi:hypothetical protein
MNPKITLNPMNKSIFFVDACYFGKKNKTDNNIINMGKLTNIELGSPRQLNDKVFGNEMCANFENYKETLCNNDTKFMLSAPMSCPSTSLYQKSKKWFNNLSCTGPQCVNGGKHQSRRYRKTKRSRKTRRHRKTKKSRKYRK